MIKGLLHIICEIPTEISGTIKRQQTRPRDGENGQVKKKDLNLFSIFFLLV